MGDAVGVQVVLLGQGELEHDLLVLAQGVELLDQFGMEQGLGLGLVRAVDVDLGLDDGHEAGGDDLLADLELLRHVGGDAFRVGLLDHGTHLGAEDAGGLRPGQQVIQIRHGLHELHAVFLVREPLVHLEDGNHLLVFPQVMGRGLALDIPVHGVFEENRRQDAVAVEGRAGDDARAHLVHQAEHLLVAVVGVFLDAVEAQGFGCAATALVQGGDEAGLRFHFLELIVKAAQGGLRQCQDSEGVNL